MIARGQLLRMSVEGLHTFRFGHRIADRAKSVFIAVSDWRAFDNCVRIKEIYPYEWVDPQLWSGSFLEPFIGPIPASSFVLQHGVKPRRFRNGHGILAAKPKYRLPLGVAQ